MSDKELDAAQAILRRLELLIEQIAMVCHETNRAYCRSIGDASLLTWDEAPQWQRDSVRLGVQFHLDNPEASASASHEAWLETKRRDGWAYGPVKDAAKKRHPCFVPHHELPVEQRVKDVLFKGVVDAMRVLGARLAPLETMTEEFRLRLELNANPLVGMCLAELDAQRLARARARREALEEAIQAVRAVNQAPLAFDIKVWICGWCNAASAIGPARVQHYTTCPEARLEAIRDREEA